MSHRPSVQASSTHPDAGPSGRCTDTDEVALRVRQLILDVDGVLTDGRIRLDHLGRETKVFHARDGLGIRAWLDSGRELAIITGRRSTALTHRARELGVPLVVQGSKDKRAALEQIVSRTGVPLDQTAAMGDDLNDLPILRAVAYPMTVADAAPEVRTRCTFVATRHGGGGAVREAIEHLLRVQGAWETIVARFAEAQIDATPELPAGPDDDAGRVTGTAAAQ